MDTFEAIHNRRTIHQYEDTTIEIDVIERCIDAAHQAPNHKLTWPWGFVVVGPKTRQKLFEMALEIRKAAKGLTPQVTALIERKFLNPGGLVIVTQAKSDDVFRSQEDYAATACAIQNFMLAAHALGYGTKWSTGAITRLSESYALFEINPDEFSIVGMLWMGTPSQIPNIERPTPGTITRHLP